MLRLLLPLVLLATAATAQVETRPPNAPNYTPAFKNQTRAPAIAGQVAFQTQQITDGLEHPWGMAVLPDGRYLVTQRTGRLTLVARNGAKTNITGLPEISVAGQGGLLDVAIAEDFATSRRIFFTYAKGRGLGRRSTAAGTGVLTEDLTQLTEVKDIFVQEPPVRDTGHFGSRIVIDGGTAFITTGDRHSRRRVQNLATTIGKVVRVTLDGGIPASNPFNGQDRANAQIYSFGHRNAQGATLHPRTGALWVLEHGPKGGDELNLVNPGQNYGWPIVTYGINYDTTPIGEAITSADGITEPVYYWDPVIAPGGFRFYEGSMFRGWRGDIVAASLRPGGLIRLKLEGDRVVGEARYLRELGRVRDIDLDRDGAILVLTDKPNGALIRITPR